ncbi:hypothetical protein Tco_0772612 [Tanacetum coccineum]|uniref:Uncharacterized protein n=1 Tax=Tanacetum coccineum TaxID=301880 RepID=A0ABQ4ZJQ7_9ASTR
MLLRILCLHKRSDTEADAPVFSDDEEIKMEDLTELVQKTTASFMDLESPENEEPIQVSSEDEAAMETETKDTSSQTIKLEEEKPPDEAKAANLKAQLFIQISFIPTDLKETPTKFEAVNGTMDDNGQGYGGGGHPHSPNTGLLKLSQTAPIATRGLNRGTRWVRDAPKPRHCRNLESYRVFLPPLNGTLGYLKEYVEKLEIDVPADLKGILDKLVELQTSISALTTRVPSLKGFKLKLLS